MKPELLAPAGDIEKARFALLYGADAIYIGAKEFSLRARATGFSMDEICEITNFAHLLGKKVYIALNNIMHDDDLQNLDNFIKKLVDISLDAIIASDPYVIEQVRRITNIPIHLSTQMSVANSVLCNYWQKQGVERIVLARELGMDEIRSLRNKATSEIEVFIHGGMCSSYSGRCLLSETMTGRDANRGDCAHSCRWEYELYHDGHLVADDFLIASRDLSSVRQIPELMEIGVDALKIEGRMKSIHYVATITNAYRNLIDDVLKGIPVDFAKYEKAIAKAENRSSGPAFLAGVNPEAMQIHADDDKFPEQDFSAVVRGSIDGKTIIEQRNRFSPGDILELFSPDGRNGSFKVQKITDEFGNVIDVANHPMQKLYLDIPFATQPYDIFRRLDQS
ncbi:MAG TPA: U32 family peptidase [Bacillota bacterium]|nr:U32 family peptidase [Bacillota bacterium]